MAIRYLLDTNTVSYILRGQPAQVRARLLAAPATEVGISVVTEAELRFGAVRRPNQTKLMRLVEEFLSRVEIAAWDSAAAVRYAELRAAQEQAGRPLGNLDLMIAAHAGALAATLVTSDQALRGLPGIVSEDWAEMP